MSVFFMFLSSVTHIASSLYSSEAVALSFPYLSPLMPLALCLIAGLIFFLWKALLFPQLHTNMTRLSWVTQLTHLLWYHLNSSFFLPLPILLTVFSGVERKGRVKECDPDTPDSACSDKQANIPRADSWHAIVTCWILFQTVRPLVECLSGF